MKPCWNYKFTKIARKSGANPTFKGQVPIIDVHWIFEPKEGRSGLLQGYDPISANEVAIPIDKESTNWDHLKKLLQTRKRLSGLWIKSYPFFQRFYTPTGSPYILADPASKILPPKPICQKKLARQRTLVPYKREYDT